MNLRRRILTLHTSTLTAVIDTDGSTWFVSATGDDRPSSHSSERDATFAALSRLGRPSFASSTAPPVAQRPWLARLLQPQR